MVVYKNYFKEESVVKTGDIKPDTFKRYVTFRKWTTKLTRNKEAVIIFYLYLASSFKFSDMADSQRSPFSNNLSFV